MKISARHGGETDTGDRGEARRTQLICLFLAAVTFVLYSPVLGHDFVNFDDFTYVTENSAIQQGFTPSAVMWAFTTGRASNWHPVTWLSHMLDYQLYGLSPGGHHLTSLLFHIANTVLLFLALKRMTGATWRSAVVAALFAWHPLHVESVAWVAERKDVLSTFFGLLTVLAYLRYVAARAAGSKAKVYYGWMLGFYVLGLLSKPMLVTLPFVLLLLDYWPLRRIVGTKDADAKGATPLGKLVLEKAPLIVLALISSVVTLIAQKNGGAMMAIEKLSFGQRAENSLVAYATYLRKMVWPSDLAIFYPIPNSLPLAQVIGAVVVLGLLSAAAIALARSKPYVLVGWLWFLGMLVPVIGLVQVGAQSLADRYSYVSLVGIFIVFVWGLADWLGQGHLNRWGAAWAVIAPVLAACLVMTWRQLPYWQNSETLFRRDLALTTNNVLAHINLGRALDDTGRGQEAKEEFLAALKLAPDSAPTLNSVGAHFARQGDVTNAIGFYNSALRNEPFFGDAHYNLGNVLASEGKFPEAVAEYSAALKIKPDSADAHNNLGAILARLGRLPEALGEFKEALRFNPNFAEAQDQYGGVLLKMGHPEVAQLHYEEAVRLKPNFAHARLKLGLTLAEQGYLQQAIPEFQTVISLEPTNVDAYFNLGAADFSLNRFSDAEAAFIEVIRLKPNDAEAHERLGLTLASEGKTDVAIHAFRGALRLRPDSTTAMRGLAWILATSPNAEWRNGGEAVSLAERAVQLTNRKQLAALSALDAAYAEVGRFDDAIKTAEEVRQLAGTSQKEIADKAAHRIELYRAGKPYRE